MSRRNPGSSFVWLAIPVVMCAFLTASDVHATPLLKGGKNGKPPAFPKNSTLCVFIQTDPKGQGRDQLLKEGVERWTKPLADRMITLVVAIGDPPAGKPNTIRYRWVNDGMLSNGMEIGPGKNDGAAQPTTSPDGSQLTGGEAVIRNALPSNTDAQKNAIQVDMYVAGIVSPKISRGLTPAIPNMPRAPPRDSVFKNITRIISPNPSVTMAR